MLSDRLSQLNAEGQERLARQRAEAAGLPYVSLVAWPLDTAVVSLVPRASAEAARAVVFYRKGKDIRVGAVDPQQTETRKLLDELQERFGVASQVFAISGRSLQAALSRYPRQVRHDQPETVGLMIGDAAANTPEIATLAELGEKITGLSPTELLSTLLAGAIAVGASDVHIEPGEGVARLRYRVDGVLQDISSFAREGWKLVLSRIKVLANLKLNVQEVPQDGSFTLQIGNATYDVRVSTLPGGHGENIVMRLLNRAARAAPVQDLGMRPHDYERFVRELKKDHGMILVTGPTGSGKTTTLAACLNEINRPEFKIITLENPIEYRLAGVEQTQVDESAGYTFAVGLRSILRQDPDVIMVGEIREIETAEVAMNAAMTGHLVFSTLHTNDAPGAITRFIEFGLKPFLLGPALNLVMAQRLVRKVCVECAEQYEADTELVERIGHILEGVAGEVFDQKKLKNKVMIRKAKGCAACHSTGYRGRIGIFELMLVTGKIEELILAGKVGSALKETAQQEGMTTLLQDAYLKVLEGITTVDEVERVTAE